jgi:hypothetical protein
MSDDFYLSACQESDSVGRPLLISGVSSAGKELQLKAKKTDQAYKMKT